MEILNEFLGSESFGIYGVILIFIIGLGQWIFQKETKVAWKELVKAFNHIFSNIPRRWNSEQERINEVKQRLVELGTDEANDELVVKEFAEYAYKISRSIGGIVEDTLNLGIKFVIFIAPPALTFYRRFIMTRKLVK